MNTFKNIKAVNNSLKEKVKSITRKTTPMSFDERIQKLKETTDGWLNYFRLASITRQAKENRRVATKSTKILYLVPQLREKKPERKRKNLIRLGVEQEMAYQWSRSRMGGWAIAQSPILGTTITLARLCKRGYESLLTYYEKVAPSRNCGKPLYTRPIRTEV